MTNSTPTNLQPSAKTLLLIKNYAHYYNVAFSKENKMLLN